MRTFLGSGDILAGPCKPNHEANGLSLDLRLEVRVGVSVWLYKRMGNECNFSGSPHKALKERME